MGAAIMAPFQMKAQNDAVESAYKATVQQNDFNAKLANEAAADATARGEREAQTTQLKYGKLRGNQIASAAASGIDVNSGSVLDTLANTELMSSIDQTTIRNNAAREAYGYKSQAYGFGLNSYNAGIKAGFDKKANALNAIGTVASSVTSTSQSLIGLL